MTEKGFNPLKYIEAKAREVQAKTQELIRRSEIWRVKSLNLVPFTRLNNYADFIFDVVPEGLDNLGKVSLQVQSVNALPGWVGKYSARSWVGYVKFELKVVNIEHPTKSLNVGTTFSVDFSADDRQISKVKTYQSAQEFRDRKGEENTKVHFSEDLLCERAKKDLGGLRFQDWDGLTIKDRLIMSGQASDHFNPQ